MPLMLAQKTGGVLSCGWFTFCGTFLLWFINGVADSLDNPFKKESSSLDPASVQSELNLQFTELLMQANQPTPTMSDEWRREANRRITTARQSGSSSPYSLTQCFEPEGPPCSIPPRKSTLPETKDTSKKFFSWSPSLARCSRRLEKDAKPSGPSDGDEAHEPQNGQPDAHFMSDDGDVPDSAESFHLERIQQKRLQKEVQSSAVRPDQFGGSPRDRNHYIGTPRRRGTDESPDGKDLSHGSHQAEGARVALEDSQSEKKLGIVILKAGDLNSALVPSSDGTYEV